MDRIHLLSTIGMIVLAGLAVLSLIQQRLVLSGTLFVFTAFSIYLREKRGRTLRTDTE